MPPVEERSTTARELARLVGLQARIPDLVGNISHGEQRQLEVAMALASQPRLLLLDEPAAGLSTVERGRLRSLLEDLPRSLPMLLIEHDMGLALGLADRVLCLHNGRPIALGRPAEVRADETVQAVYLGRTAAHA
jgi:branched-chain amino acid transport system ATP-binding protein